jgi:hypothetical protein
MKQLMKTAGLIVRKLQVIAVFIYALITERDQRT